MVITFILIIFKKIFRILMIDYKYIKEIFKFKKILKNDKDKVELSKYTDYIPLFNIYTFKIIPVKSIDVRNKTNEGYFQIITRELYNLLIQKFNELEKDDDLYQTFVENFLILKNYDLDILENTSKIILYEILYRSHIDNSICVKPSFNPYYSHLVPYYTNIELDIFERYLQFKKINFNKKIKLIDLTPEEILKNEKSLNIKQNNICHYLQLQDFTKEEIGKISEHIIDNNLISCLSYYSFMGSMYLNNALRNTLKLDSILHSIYLKMINNVQHDKNLITRRVVYRYCWYDDFLLNLEKGDIYIDSGFLSTSRSFYFEGSMENTFGLVFIKIIIAPEYSNMGYLIENFSLFPKELEFVFPPNSKFRLKNVNDDIAFFHINPLFECSVKKRYEFEFLGCDVNDIPKITIYNRSKEIKNLINHRIYGKTQYEKLYNFVGDYDKISITINKNKYLFRTSWFNGSRRNVYRHLFYNQVKKGLLLSIFDNDYPYLNIELGSTLSVNYLNKLFKYNNKKEVTIKDIDIIIQFAKAFNYKKIIIFMDYRHFNSFNKDSSKKVESYYNFYNHSLYDYLKNNNKYLKHPFIISKIDWSLYKKLFSKELPIKIIDELELKYKNFGDNYIDIIENNFFKYSNFVNMVNNEDDIMTVNNIRINLDLDDYLILEIDKLLKYEGYTIDNTELKYIDDDVEINNLNSENIQFKR